MRLVPSGPTVPAGNTGALKPVMISWPSEAAQLKVSVIVIPVCAVPLMVLVFEVPQDHVEEAAAVVADRMEQAIDLEVALRAHVGWGPNWAEATPAGH